jgi:hypothetical protein
VNAPDADSEHLMTLPRPEHEPRWRFLLLTVSLVAWMLIAPHAGHRWLVQLLLQLFLIHFVVITLWANPGWSRMRMALIACWLLSLASTAWLMMAPEHNARLARSLQSAALIPLVTLLASGVLRYVFARRKLDADGLFATVSGYILVGMVFAQVYTLLVLWDPHSFNAAVPLATLSPQELHGDLIYFSLITLATVGYGDISPLSDTARTVAVIEATVGQFYVAVIVAAFVGMYAARQGRPE